VSAPGGLVSAIEAARAALTEALRLAETPEEVEEIAAEAERILGRDERTLIEQRLRTLEAEARTRPVRVQRPGSRLVRFAARACMAIGAMVLAGCVSDEPPSCRECHRDCGVLRDSCHEECEASLCSDAGVDGGEQMEDGGGWT
jgi:hypothetical protein